MSLVRSGTLVTLAVVAAIADPSATAARRAYVVTAKTVSEARHAVDAVGGAVTGDLPIITAVAARLTEELRTALLHSQPGTRLFPDSAVKLAAVVTSPAPPAKNRDNNKTASWSNNDGDHLWATNWV